LLKREVESHGKNKLSLGIAEPDHESIWSPSAKVFWSIDDALSDFSPLNALFSMSLG
jgi:hypothetical protein